MHCWQLVFKDPFRNTLFPSQEGLLRAIRALARVVGDELVSFCIVDDHAHIDLLCAEKQLPSRARSLRMALRAYTEVDIQRPWVGAVRGRSHMETLIGYCVGQPTHHNLVGHAALWPGSCFADLIGARLLPGLKLRVADVLPRYDLRAAYNKVGINAPLQPVSAERLRELGAFRLRDAALAVLAIPALHPQQGTETNAIRTAMVHLGQRAGIPASEISAAAGIGDRGLRRHRAKPTEDRLLRAILLRLALELAAGKG